ncbi:AE binding protein 2 [Rhinolophus ferrumequinum]|uniref:AE binding protein 2 n=1 Tax=Rhinolophus ferrumequinum TaxID=59479 RepID=A0A7J7WN39_RHIFE|nr:AE binding protein 2 [Rhinolophus ferrumequinum]
MVSEEGYLFAYGKVVKYITLRQPVRVGYRGIC